MDWKCLAICIVYLAHLASKSQDEICKVAYVVLFQRKYEW